MRKQLLQGSVKSMVSPRVTGQGSQLYQCMGHRGDSADIAACPLELGNRKPQGRAVRGVRWRCELHTKCCDLKAGGIRTVYLHHGQSLPLQALNRYGHTFVLYLKSLDTVKNSCHSVQR